MGRGPTLSAIARRLSALQFAVIPQTQRNTRATLLFHSKRGLRPELRMLGPCIPRKAYLVTIPFPMAQPPPPLPPRSGSLCSRGEGPPAAGASPATLPPSAATSRRGCFRRAPAASPASSAGSGLLFRPPAGLASAWGLLSQRLVSGCAPGLATPLGGREGGRRLPGALAPRGFARAARQSCGRGSLPPTCILHIALQIESNLRAAWLFILKGKECVSE